MDRTATSPSEGPSARRGGAYGAELGDAFRIGSAPAFVNRGLKAGLLAVTETRDDAPELTVSNPIPIEDAFLATLHLAIIRDHVAWEAGRQYPVETLQPGQLLVRDLKRDPSVLVAQPHHELHFYVPRAALDMIADDADARRIDHLHYAPGAPVNDMVVASLGMSILRAFSLPEQANILFLDHLMQAVATHLAVTYGELRPGSRPRRGGLTPVQERRAKAVIDARLSGDLQLADIARECGISASHFQKAFRTSTGVAPHQWLLLRRVDAAKTKLRNGSLSLAEVALACGFADQSHFTRVFTHLIGDSPGRWRRQNDIPTAQHDQF